MSLRPFLLVILVLPACAGASRTADPTCDELAAHAVELRLHARTTPVPEADRDAHRAALSAAMMPAFESACARMTADGRACWRDAESDADLDSCPHPDGDDVSAVARTRRVPVEDLDILMVEH